jgi:hypothetical protein
MVNGNEQVEARFSISALEVSRYVSDKYTMMIIAACAYSPRSAQALSLAYDIPIAACYRKIHLLEQAGLLSCEERILTREGKRIKLYRSHVKKIGMNFENGRLSVRIEMNEFPSQVESQWDAGTSNPELRARTFPLDKTSYLVPFSTMN